MTADYDGSALSDIPVVATSNFDTFEGVGVGTTNYGYAILGNEIIQSFSTYGIPLSSERNRFIAVYFESRILISPLVTPVKFIDSVKFLIVTHIGLIPYLLSLFQEF